MTSEFSETRENLIDSLGEHDYAAFIKLIIKMPINDNNYKLYLDMVEQVLNAQMKSEDEIFNESKLSSGDIILDLYNKNVSFINGEASKQEKSFFEWLPDLKSAIVEIFKIKLNIKGKKVTFSDEEESIMNSLDVFEGRFML